MFEFYKIKNPNQEEYGSGLRNGYIHQSKKGKTWNSIGALKSHLTMVQRFDQGGYEAYYKNWVIIKITENGIEGLGTVKDFK